MDEDDENPRRQLSKAIRGALDHIPREYFDKGVLGRRTITDPEDPL